MLEAILSKISEYMQYAKRLLEVVFWRTRYIQE